MQIEGLRLAQEQAASNARRANAGTLAPIDATDALTQVASSQQSVFQAQRAVTAAETQLRADAAESRRAAVAGGPGAGDPLELTPPAIAVDQAIATALSNRPEISESEVSASINETDVDTTATRRSRRSIWSALHQRAVRAGCADGGDSGFRTDR